MEECTVSEADASDNFLSGLLFIIVFLTLLLVLCTTIKYGIDGIRRELHVGITLRYLIVFLLIVSIIMGIGDIVHSFRVTSQVYRKLLDGFQQQGQVNCSSSTYYSLVVVVFNYIFVEIGLLLLLCFWFIFDFHNYDYTARSYSYI